MSERIYTRCTACHNDTLTINKGHLLCTWHKCGDPGAADALLAGFSHEEEHKEQPAHAPTCPRCFDSKLIGHSLGYWYCPNCIWMQPDAKQRPKMPDARDGYHYEWRLPKFGEECFDGILWMKAHIDFTNAKMWIAVKDAPVPRCGCGTEMTQCVLPASHQGGCKIEPRGKDAPVPVVMSEPMPDHPVLKPCCWRKFEVVCGDDPNEWHTDCRKEFLLNENGPVHNGFMFCPFCGRPIQDNSLQASRRKPADKVPVVRYVYRLQPGAPRDESKTYEIGFCNVNRDPETASMWCDRRVCEGFWGDEEACKKAVAALNSAYEAAKLPEKQGKRLEIEPLRVFDRRDFDERAFEKINEIVIRVNELGRDGGEAG